MAISSARKIAFEVLRRVEAEAAYASDVLHTELRPSIRANDAALATELAMGVLRRRGLLDFLLERQLNKPLARLDLAVVLALRLGIYQLRFLPRIPPRAAVNESVELVKRARKASAGSLVNAVLRRSAEEASTPAEAFLPADLSLAARLSIIESHPQWMIERWQARFGEAPTLALLRANNRPPRLSCVLYDPSLRDTIFAELEKTGLKVEDGRLLRSAFAVSGGSLAATLPFREGRISIQDEASQAVALLVDVQQGHRVLDVCAAPGGKTALLAQAAGPGGIVVAGDLHLHRLRALQDQVKRLGLKRIYSVNLDATAPLPFGMTFDRVLVDAPCSGTGTLSRHPEIRWRLGPEQLAELHRLQVAILSRGIASVKAGGKLVYSTCSLEPEENEEVIAATLRGTGSLRVVARSEISGAFEKYLAANMNISELFDDAGPFRTIPGQQATDGFFAVVLERR